MNNFNRVSENKQLTSSDVATPENIASKKQNTLQTNAESQDSIPWWRIFRRFYRFSERPEKIHRQTYDFMPAALEVQETPPSPTGRAIIGLIVFFFMLAVIWAFFGRVDIVAVAQGKVIPSGRVKTIQPLEIGSVAKIHVKEGQHVNAQDPLVTLDSTATAADSLRFSNQLADLELALYRQKTFQKFLAKKVERDKAREHYNSELSTLDFVGDPIKIQHNLNLLTEEINEYLSKKQILNSEAAKRDAELEGAEATITKLEKTLPIITERTKSLKKLFDGKLIAKDQYLELEQQRISEQQDLLTLKARKRELEAAVQENKSQVAALLAETQKAVLIETAESLQNIQAIKQELIKAEQRNRMQVLSSPIAGTVQQLVVHTIGGIVTPAQELMLVVPDQAEVEVEAFLLNKDVGFVWEGQIAEVKIDTFNFTKYGTIDAEVIDISNDAIQDENLGLVYLTRVLLKKSNILVNGRLINLSPGMSVTVEVKTGKRRIIEYFLSPLLRYKQESIRER